MVRVYQSQRSEGLASTLAQHLYEKRDPFALPWVVVPNQAVKEWLSHHLAQEWGVAMGIRFLFLEEALRELAQSPHPFPNRFELALKIAKVLEGGDFGPASTYAQKGERHLISLSNALADPLMHWGVYGEGVVGGPPWQQALVRGVYRGRKTPHELLEGKAPVVTPPALHIFGFTHLPPLYLRYLAQTPFTLYLFTPCAQFWTDTVSEKAALRLEIPQETNPLLADWGRLNRRLLKALEEGEAEVFEDYPLPKEVAEHEAYADYLGGELSFREGELTRLTALQTDLVLMRKEGLGMEDETLRIYGAQSRLAEVELCAREVLERGIDPEGLLVMAPDITPLRPLH